MDQSDSTFQIKEDVELHVLHGYLAILLAQFDHVSPNSDVTIPQYLWEYGFRSAATERWIMLKVEIRQRILEMLNSKGRHPYESFWHHRGKGSWEQGLGRLRISTKGVDGMLDLLQWGSPVSIGDR